MTPAQPKKRPSPAYQAVPNSNIRENGWKRGYLTPLEFLRIQAWKSANSSLAYITLPSEAEFTAVTSHALSEMAPWRRKGAPQARDSAGWAAWKASAVSALTGSASSPGLCSLSGVALPRATAIMAFMDPETWPIIDQHGVRVIFGSRSATQDHRDYKWANNADAFAVYAEALVSQGAPAWDTSPPSMTIHQLDQRAMQIGTDERTKLRLRAHDRTTPVPGLPSSWKFRQLP